MQQVGLFLHGERDYTKITGGTGPLVYPAAHVYIYTALYYVTNEGRNIALAQGIFAVLYLGTLAVVMACYRLAKVPPYVFPMLILSKRLHSIFLLRCFNDCFAVLFFWIAIYAYQRRIYTVGSIAYSWGLGIKMSLLLALPAIGSILLLTRGIFGGLRQASLMGQLQVLIAFPFLPVNAMGYLNRAFEFSRQFLYKWTVNWRFVGEQTFLSREFSGSLLVGHASVVVLFILTRWLRPAGTPVIKMVQGILSKGEPLGDMQRDIVSRRITPSFVLTTALTANFIGMLFARSLHYQFFAYLAWATPFLLWKSGFHPVLQYVLWAAQEWAWNVYPSTDSSSKVVVGVLVVTVAGIWWGTRNDFADAQSPRNQPVDVE